MAPSIPCLTELTEVPHFPYLYDCGRSTCLNLSYSTYLSFFHAALLAVLDLSSNSHTDKSSGQIRVSGVIAMATVTVTAMATATALQHDSKGKGKGEGKGEGDSKGDKGSDDDSDSKGDSDQRQRPATSLSEQ